MTSWQADVVSDLTDDATFTVTRPAPGAHDGSGRWVAGETSTFSIVASVQPIRRELLPLPEGRRVQDSRSIVTVTELREEDRLPILVNGVAQTFEVFEVQGPFTLEGESCYEALAAKVAAS